MAQAPNRKGIAKRSAKQTHKAGLARLTQLKRTPLKRKPNKNVIPQASRDAVTERSGGRCEFVFEGLIGRCFAEADSRGPHHIERRRGKNHDPANLLDLCPAHHAYVHANPAWSYEHGYMKRFGKDS